MPKAIPGAGRRGLAVFFALVVPLTAVFQAIIITTGDPLWIFP